VTRWPEITLAAGCAVAEGVETVAELPVRLKWPNDVLVRGRKVAGILAEGVAGAPSPPSLVVLGIGVNVSQGLTDWPADLVGRAESLAGLSTHVARERLLTAILARLEAWYGVLLDAGFEPVRAAWRARGLFGRSMALADGPGTAVDLGPRGELVARNADGRTVRLVSAGDARPGRAKGESS
jgi:BirA family biotin operon repressor/biotin-[acetyl-CoA-carboxylase] ligase